MWELNKLIHTEWLEQHLVVTLSVCGLLLLMSIIITFISIETMKPKSPDWKLCLFLSSGLYVSFRMYIYIRTLHSLTTFCFTTYYHPQSEFTELHNPTSPQPVFYQYLKHHLLNAMQRTEEKLILCCLWKQNGISEGFLIRSYFLTLKSSCFKGGSFP